MFANANFDTQEPELSLEPRLLEYLEKKKSYKNKSFESENLEKYYAITQKDINFINNYLSGKKNDTSSDFVEHKVSKFGSENLHNDFRLHKMEKKQLKDKEALEQKNNYDDMYRKYDMYKKNSNFASATNNDFKTVFNPRIWLENNNKQDNMVANSKANDMKNRFAGMENTKNVPPPYKDNRNFPSSNNYTLDSIISKIDGFNDKVSCQNFDYDENPNLENLMNLNNNNKKKKNIDVENYLQYGSTPNRSSKSLGYPTLAEHHFSYISNDISSPDHTVFERGMPSRLFNKDIARQYKSRDIMM